MFLIEILWLKSPAGLAHTGDETVRSHLAEVDAGDAELTHIALGATRHLADVVQSHGRCVAGQLLQCLIVTVLLELGALGGILSDEALTLGLAGFH